MTTALITHPASHSHVTPEGHPERVARIEAIEQVLSSADFDDLLRLEAATVSRTALEAVHPGTYIDRIASSIPVDDYRSLDADTHVSPGSLEAAYRAAGGNVQAVDLVLSGQVNNAFVACRPPGHHAETQTAMGFCLFGSVVVGARHALTHPDINKVAIMDFDVHHGNGTQDLVWNDPNIQFVSTHQMPLYPGSGARNETGAHGNVVNIPIEPGTSGDAYMRIFDREVVPALDEFAPDLIMISAGFDAHKDDPLANLGLEAVHFGAATARICALADKHCAGRVVSTLEGGYDLAGLATSVAAHVQVLMEQGS